MSGRTPKPDMLINVQKRIDQKTYRELHHDLGRGMTNSAGHDDPVFGTELSGTMGANI